MAEQTGATPDTAVTGAPVLPSFGNALPYFLSLGVFPFMAVAAVQGSWWIAAPYLYFMIPDVFDAMSGADEGNMDPRRTIDQQLSWYKLSCWAWGILWPVTFVFCLWQMFMSGHLSLLEVILMAFVLTTVGQVSFIVGHELIHRRAVWERRLGEVILASVSYPTYASEHIFVHHSLVGTPGDPGSAPKGVSFWRYLPREIKSNFTGAWIFERQRLARRRLPVWHYTNPFWRYVGVTAAWYVLMYWMGGPWAVLGYVILCTCIIMSMKLINYVQHYGLRRIRLPNGRYERVQPWHSWSAAYKLSNWFFFNMQRHPDHHIAPGRRYPLLQHCGADAAPQLPGTYVEMAGLAVRPRRWFEKMDPRVDRWRKHFYPGIDDWSAYDSPATAERARCLRGNCRDLRVGATARRLDRPVTGTAGQSQGQGIHRSRSAEGIRSERGSRVHRPPRPHAALLDTGVGCRRNAGAHRRLPGPGCARNRGCGQELVQRQGVPDRDAYLARQPDAH